MGDADKHHTHKESLPNPQVMTDTMTTNTTTTNNNNNYDNDNNNNNTRKRKLAVKAANLAREVKRIRREIKQVAREWHEAMIDTNGTSPCQLQKYAIEDFRASVCFIGKCAKAIDVSVKKLIEAEELDPFEALDGAETEEVPSSDEEEEEEEEDVNDHEEQSYYQMPVCPSIELP